MKRTSQPYRRITNSEVLNRLFQYGVFEADETLGQVVEELSLAGREMRKLARQHGAATRLGKVTAHYQAGERVYMDEMRQSLARLEPRKSAGRRGEQA
jgi:hypothetical protein